MNPRTKTVLVALVSGLIFGVGLVLGGMTQPSKVIAFLDFFGGAWDPSLAFVMGGAILVYAPVHALFVKRRATPLLSRGLDLPTNRAITFPLIAGSAVFGVGWGLGGFCPGPGLVSLSTFGVEAITFVGAMTAGMVFHRFLTREPSSSPPKVAADPVPGRTAVDS